MRPTFSQHTPRRGLAALAVVWLVVSAASVAAQAASETPAELRGAEVVEQLGAAVPLGLRFRDEEGRSVTLRDYWQAERPVVLVLNYYSCPSLCSLVLNGMVEGLQQVDFELGEDYDIVAVSIHPEERYDLASAKRNSYAEFWPDADVMGGWHFLSVAPEAPAEVEELADAVGFGYRYDETTKQYAHGAALIFTSPEGLVVRYLGGVRFEPADVRLALLEASEGRIGSPWDRIFFRCFHYDPTTGRYTPAIFNILRAVGAVTVICLGTMILLLLLREGRREPPVEEASPMDPVLPQSAEALASGRGNPTGSDA